MVIVDILIWIIYIAVFVWLFRKGSGHDVMLSGKVGFGIQAFAFVATYISAVALVGFGGLAYQYGMQMLLIAAGNVWLGTWIVYRYLAWPTRVCQRNLGARTPVQLLAKGHRSPLLGRCLALVFAVFLGVYASAVIKGAALLLEQILPLPAGLLVWAVALLVGLAVFVGGLRGVLYTEAMQGFVMLIGISMLIFAVFDKVGGPVSGMLQLAALEPTKAANTGFVHLAEGGEGWFIISLVIVTSVAVWAQPQMIQRHFALASSHQVDRITPLAMFVLTVLVGGAYYVASLGRLFLPPVASPDAVMPTMVKMLLPEVGLQLFVLAIASASLSTATAIFHIAVSAIAEDLPGSKATRPRWLMAIAFIVLLSAGCAQIKGQIIAMLCATSWSVVGAAVLVSYVALVRFGRRSSRAAWMSFLLGFGSCLLWYLMTDRHFAVLPMPWPALSKIPPFFVGFGCSLLGWLIGWCLDPEARKNSHFWPEESAGSSSIGNK
ncbi:MAG: sodium:solute symporter family protein [Desulfovibrio sp.]|nr:sodium:solute symporter family protein [Desulfovibrio sp.]